MAAKNLSEYYGASLAPGQTVAQRFALPGFKDAATKAGFNETNYGINANNADANTAILANLNGSVPAITPSTGYSSSMNVTGQFNADSATLDNHMASQPQPDPNAKPDPTKVAPPKVVLPKGAEGETPDNRASEIDQGKTTVDTWAADQKNQYTSLYNTSLSNIDSTYNSQVQGLNALFDKRIAEQTRINKLNIDRVKAYGLGGGNAQYVPIEYTDSVSLREKESADAIQSLDQQRQAALAAAKSARDTGQADLLRKKLDDINTIDTTMRTRMEQVAKDAQDEYDRVVSKRKQQEADHQVAVQKMVSFVTSKYADAFINAKTTEERNKIVEKAMEEYGVDSKDTNLYQSALAGFGTVLSKNRDEQKELLDIDAKKATIANTKSETAKRYADMAKAGADTEKNPNGYTDDQMKKLRAYNIDPKDQKTADAFLYKDEEPSPANDPYVGAIQQGIDKQDKLPTGQPVLDDKGYITADAFKYIIENKPDSLSRADLLTAIKGNLYLDRYKFAKNYGLTEQEFKDLKNN